MATDYPRLNTRQATSFLLRIFWPWVRASPCCNFIIKLVRNPEVSKSQQQFEVIETGLPSTNIWYGLFRVSKYLNHPIIGQSFTDEIANFWYSDLHYTIIRTIFKTISKRSIELKSYFTRVSQKEKARTLIPNRGNYC